jgi:hypothetical protein
MSQHFNEVQPPNILANPYKYEIMCADIGWGGGLGSMYAYYNISLKFT